MTRHGVLIVTCGVVLAVRLAVTVAAQVPMYQEPHHHLVFQDDALRIVEPRIDPGDTTLDHIHSHDGATVCISGSTMRSRVLGAEWGEIGSPCSTGRVTVTEYVGHQVTHRAQNMGDSPFRLISIENLKDGDWSRTEPLAAPFTKLLQDTRAFRIYEVNLRAGNEGTLHVHRRPAVTVLVSGELAVTHDGHNELIRFDQPGRWSLIAAGESLRLTAGGSGEALAVEVEVR